MKNKLNHDRTMMLAKEYASKADMSVKGQDIAYRAFLDGILFDKQEELNDEELEIIKAELLDRKLYWQDFARNQGELLDKTGKQEIEKRIKVLDEFIKNYGKQIEL